MSHFRWVEDIIRGDNEVKRLKRRSAELEHDDTEDDDEEGVSPRQLAMREKERMGKTKNLKRSWGGELHRALWP